MCNVPVVGLADGLVSRLHSARKMMGKVASESEDLYMSGFIFHFLQSFPNHHECLPESPYSSPSPARYTHAQTARARTGFPAPFQTTRFHTARWNCQSSRNAQRGVNFRGGRDRAQKFAVAFHGERNDRVAQQVGADAREIGQHHGFKIPVILHIIQVHHHVKVGPARGDFQRVAVVSAGLFGGGFHFFWPRGRMWISSFFSFISIKYFFPQTTFRHAVGWSRSLPR